MSTSSVQNKSNVKLTKSAVLKMSKSSLQEMFPDLQNTKPEMVSIIMGNEKFRERVSDWLAQNNPVVKPRPSKKTEESKQDSEAKFTKSKMKSIRVKILREITELDGTKKEIEAVVMKDKGRQEKVTEWLSKNSATTSQKKEQKSEEDEQIPAKDEQTPPKEKQKLEKDEQTPDEEEQDLEEEEQTPPKDEQTPPKDKQNLEEDKQTPAKDKQNLEEEEQTPAKDEQTPEKEVVSEEEEEKESDDEESDEENSADAEQSEEDVKCDVYEYDDVQYHCDSEQNKVYLKSELFGYAVEVFCNSNKRLPIPGHVVVKDLISDPEEGNKYTCLLSKIEVVLTNGEWIIPKKSKKKKSKKAKKPEDSEEPE